MTITSTLWKTPLRRLLLGSALAAPLALLGSTTQAQTIYGLTGGTTLISLNATTPTLPVLRPITGVTSGQVIVGLDVRPNTGQLFALGYNPTLTAANTQVYSIDPTTGAATAAGAAISLALGDASARIGFDFNPTVDRIRVISSNNANYRLNPNNGALAATDTNLNFLPGSGPAAGETSLIGAAAYTNSYIGATDTRLFDVDEQRGLLLLQENPNGGTLRTVGSLGVTTSGVGTVTDLDIYFNPTGTAADRNAAFLSVASATGTSLYSVNLTTGAATLIPGATLPISVTDIAIGIDRPATLPALVGPLVYALAGTNLLTFDAANPTLIRTSTGITGLPADQTLAGMDLRPATNKLFALGYNATVATPTANSQVYAVNTLTGALTAVGAPIRLDLGTSAISFDFNPVVDRIRVVGANRKNYRLNPNDGTLVLADGDLAYATTDANAAATPNIGAVAYTNSTVGTTPTETVLYDYDLSLNILARQDANPGTLTTIGATGLTVNTATPNVDMDIYSVGTTNTAYLVANGATSPNTTLYTINISTGAATAVGGIGYGIAARDIAIAGAGGVTTPVKDRTDLVGGFDLFPNPVVGAAAISFQLPKASSVELGVFDAVGRQVKLLSPGKLNAGTHTLNWNAPTSAKGIYYFRLVLDGTPAGTRRGVVVN